MRPMTSFTLHAILATAIAAFATASAAAAPAYMRFEPIKGDINAKEDHRDQIEILSYSWGSPQSAGRVSKVDALPVKQNVKPADGARGGNVEYEWKVEEGESAPPRPAGDMTLKGSKIGENSAAGTGGGHGSGKVSTHDISTTSAKPAAKGTVWVRVASPWAGCRVGARYPSITLSAGAKSHILHDVSVANCGNSAAGRPTEEVAFYYNRIAFNY